MVSFESRGSSADLSGPPRRGPRELLPRGHLHSNTTGRCQRGGSDCSHRRASPRGDISNHGEAARGRLPVASPLFPEEPRPPIARLARSREGSSWRRSGELSWFIPPGPSTSLAALPTRATPIVAALLAPKSSGEYSHRPADSASVVAGPHFLSVMSLVCGHGSPQTSYPSLLCVRRTANREHHARTDQPSMTRGAHARTALTVRHGTAFTRWRLSTAASVTTNLDGTTAKCDVPARRQNGKTPCPAWESCRHRHLTVGHTHRLRRGRQH